MKKIIDQLKEIFYLLKDQAIQSYLIVRDWFVSSPLVFFRNLPSRLLSETNTRERNRILVIALSLVFLLDYVMFSYHVEKNVLNIFPSFPLMNQRTTATLYLPSVNKSELFKEEREIPDFDSDDKNVRYLFTLVTKGSIYENTSMTVPINLRIRKIWLLEESGECVIDVDADTIPEGSFIIKGSEALFRSAVEKTVRENIPSIKSVTILEKGILDRSLWEM